MRQFVESFALVFSNAGMQRTAARTFVALLASESGNMTARQIADTLQVSPAAVSGAVRYLENAGLARREREPGKRVDHYVLGDEFWYESMVSRSEFFDPMANSLETGIDAVGSNTSAGRRLEETQDFFAYLRKEMPRMLERWRASREV